MNIDIKPIGFVKAGRTLAEDDFWGGEEACISLAEPFTFEALQGLASFSHAEVLFLFHQVPDSKIVFGARHPRNNVHWPAVGIFAQRGKNRPNRIGVTVCRVVSVSGRTLEVEGLDAIDGTPVLDIKPYLSGFAPRGAIKEPQWSKEIMAEYW